jgi:DNA-binding beta-propeller fold protein YncE
MLASSLHADSPVEASADRAAGNCRSAGSASLNQSDRHRQAMDLFLAAIEQPTAERCPFVERVCTDDRRLLDDVCSLLEADRRAARLERPGAVRLASALQLELASASGAREGEAWAQLEERYEVLGPLAQGGMGTLYRVRHRELGDIRVLKVMRPMLALDPRRRSQLQREARVVSRLRHPNIARALDLLIAEDGTSFLVMEELDGLDLRRLLSVRVPLPLEAAVEIGRQALRGLAHVHDHGFLHRDVAPDNLMLARAEDGTARVRLLDLGIAQDLYEEGRSPAATLGGFSGKVRYSAPERFADPSTGREDGRSDLYSMGLVLYELLTGRFPLPGNDLLGMVAGHRIHAPAPFERSDPRGRVPNAVREVVLRSLAKDPADRFASAREMAAALDAASPIGRTPADLARLLDEAHRAVERAARRRALGIAVRSRVWRGAALAAALTTIATTAVLASRITRAVADAVVGVERTKLEAYLPVTTFGRPGNGPGELNRPTGVALGSEGDLYVVSVDGSQVERFRLDGSPVASFGNFGSGPGELNWPVALAVHANGDVLVVDQRNERIQRYTATGAFLQTYATRGPHGGPLRYPDAIATSPDGTFYVLELDISPPRVTRLALDGAWLGSWSHDGAHGLTAIAVDSVGGVWVAGGTAVRRHSPDGALLAVWDQLLDPGGALGVFHSLAVGSNGSVALTTSQHQVLVVAATGELLRRFGVEGDAPGSFRRPASVAIGPRGDLFVAEESNHRVQRFLPPPDLQVWRTSPPPLVLEADAASNDARSSPRRPSTGDGA